MGFHECARNSSAENGRESRKQVARLMRKLGSVGMNRRAGGLARRFAGSDARSVADLVERNFSTERPD